MSSTNWGESEQEQRFGQSDCRSELSDDSIQATYHDVLGYKSDGNDKNKNKHKNDYNYNDCHYILLFCHYL